jgi:glyceraldehyde 3-phosphate dehydrogenase
VLYLHQTTQILTGYTLHIDETLKIAKIISNLDLSPSRIDIGKLILKIHEQAVAEEDIRHFIGSELAGATSYQAFNPRDVVLYGFGRIGRLLARELIGKSGSGNQLRLRAIVTRDSVNASTLQKRAAMLRQDSIHGNFEGEVDIDIDKQALVINGITVYIITAHNPEEIDYTIYDIHNALIIDNTGAFRDEPALARHLHARGASQVLLTAPGKGIPNIVYGVNDDSIDTKTTALFSAASCTTNAIAPVLDIVHATLGIEQGHIETIHAYTNDQNLVDNMHKKARRGRAAAINMVITETGAGSAVASVLPQLTGRLTSNAIRVPVPNGSLAILHLQLHKAIDMEGIRKILKKGALEGDLVEQIKYSDNKELVSSDIVGASAAAVVDVPATIISSDGQRIVLYVWYDNEYGYTHQVMRLARHIAGVRRFTYY